MPLTSKSKFDWYLDDPTVAGAISQASGERRTVPCETDAVAREKRHGGEAGGLRAACVRTVRLAFGQVEASGWHGTRYGIWRISGWGLSCGGVLSVKKCEMS